MINWLNRIELAIWIIQWTLFDIYLKSNHGYNPKKKMLHFSILIIVFLIQRMYNMMTKILEYWPPAQRCVDVKELFKYVWICQKNVWKEQFKTNFTWNDIILVWFYEHHWKGWFLSFSYITLYYVCSFVFTAFIATYFILLLNASKRKFGS